MNPVVERLPGPPRITSDPDVMGGRPCIDGTRVPAEVILTWVNGGESDEIIYGDFARIPWGSIELVLNWARKHGYPVSLPDRRVPIARTG